MGYTIADYARPVLVNQVDTGTAVSLGMIAAFVVIGSIVAIIMGTRQNRNNSDPKDPP